MKRSFILLVLLIASHSLLFSQMTGEKEIKKHLPGLAGVNNSGTDFWIALPPPYLVNAPGDFFKLYITSPQKTMVTLESPGTGLFQQKETLPNDVIVFDISFAQAEPFNYTCCRQDTPEVQVYDGRGMHLFADKSFTVYAVVRIRWTSDGYLAIPTNSLGTEYIAAPYTSRPFKGINSLPNMVTLVAAYDKTKITMTLGGIDGTSIMVQGKGEVFPGEESTFRMDKGDVLVIPTIATKEDQTIAGSYFKGTKPFVLISGHFCADIPTTIRACDYNVELDLPMHTWGKHYFIPKIQNRDHSGLLRIFAKEAPGADGGTTVYKDGYSFGYISGGRGGILNDAWLENRVWPRIDNGDKPKIALYSADKPISITYFNPSAQDDAGGTNSDPFSMLITPVEQFQTEIVFSTPAAKGGNTVLNGYKENYLMMVYETDDPSGRPPDDIEWGVISNANTEWKKVSTAFSGKPFKYYTLDGADGEDDIDWDTPYDGKIYGHLNIQLPGQGVYGVRSVGELHKFAVYAYGYDTWDSYGWPTSAALLDLTVPDVDAPTVTKGPNCSQTEWNGTVQEQPDDPSRRSGFYSISLDYTTSENFTFEYEPDIKPSGSGKGAVHSWRLTVDDPKLSAYGILIFQDRAGNYTKDTTEYFPPELNVYEKIAGYNKDWDYIEDWGLRETGQVNAKTTTFIVENLSESNTFNIAGVSLQKNDEGFTITKINGIDFVDFTWTFDLLPKTSITIDVEFWTDDQGAFRDFLSVYDCDGGEYAAIELNAHSGSSVISVTDVNFGMARIPYYNDVNSNNVTPLPGKITIYNACDGETGNSDLKISDFSVPANSIFDVSEMRTQFNALRGTDGFVTIGQSIGDKVQFNISFKPTASGTFTDQITFTSPNAGTCKFVSELVAYAKESNFSVYGNNWGENRILRTGEPETEIDAKNGALTMVNSSNDDSDIKNVTVGSNAENFEFYKGAPDNAWLNLESEKDKFINLVKSKIIRAKNSANPIIHPIRYAPRVKQIDNVQITFDSRSPNPEGGDLLEIVTVALEGIPILPSMNFYQGTDPASSDDVNFGAMIRGDVSNNVIKTFTIENTPESSTFGDVLTVRSIDLTGISAAGAFGTNSYRLVNALTPTPFTIPIGGTYQFDVEFLAQSEGLKNASITVQHDGDTQKWNSINDNATLNLVGFGQYRNPQVITDDFTACVGNPIYGGFTVSNFPDDNIADQNFTDANGIVYSILAPVSLDVKVDWTGIISTFQPYLVSDEPSLVLDNEDAYISATFTPGIKGDVNNNNLLANPKVLISYDDVTTDNASSTMSAEITLSSYEITGNIAQSIQIFNKNGDEQTKPSNPSVMPNLNFEDDVIYSLIFSEKDGDNFEEAAMTELNFRIEYRKDFLQVEVEKNNIDKPVINVGSGFVGDFEIDNITSDQDLVTGINTITFRVKSTDPDNIFIMGSDREIVNIKFTSYLPNYTNEDKDIVGYDKTNIFKVNVKSRLLEFNNDCANMSYEDNQELELSAVCKSLYNTRDFVTTGASSQNAQLTPNIISGTANLSFSMGLGGPTTVRVVNLQGKTVGILFEGNLDAGYHDIAVPADTLENGMYFYEIISENYYSRDKFQVSK